MSRKRKQSKALRSHPRNLSKKCRPAISPLQKRPAPEMQVQSIILLASKNELHCKIHFFPHRNQTTVVWCPKYLFKNATKGGCSLELKKKKKQNHGIMSPQRAKSGPVICNFVESPEEDETRGQGWHRYLPRQLPKRPCSHRRCCKTPQPLAQAVAT